MGRLNVKAIPKASRCAVTGWIGDALKVQITAAPERGKANLAVMEVIATVLSVPRRSVCVVSGATNARKLIEVAGLTENEIRTRIEKYLENT